MGRDASPDAVSDDSTRLDQLKGAAGAYINDGRIDPAARGIVAAAVGLEPVLSEQLRRERIDNAFETLGRYLRTIPKDRRDTEFRREVLAEIGRMVDSAEAWLARRRAGAA